MSFNRLQTMRDNIEAIRLALSFGVKGRGAQTAEEREMLRKYAGFGGLKCILNDANECKYSLKSGPVSHSKMGHPRERTKLIK